MYEIQEEEQKKVRALLVSAPKTSLAELSGLIDTLGMEKAGEFELNRMEISPAYGMGKGKAEEIAAHAKAINADCIIMDFELEPTKQRNWEALAKMPVFDRQEVILRIFASRARTREATLQVELARLNYSLPRLAHMYGDMARQRGGNYGSKGSGEKQLELDRRQVKDKIRQLKIELEKVSRNREVQRKRREKIPLPAVAIAGYTNAGKSSLLNALTNADAFVENKLFATLDPLTRRLKIPGTQDILLTDTVGFISNLPHTLVDAFKSTLEESARADLLLIVIDASDPDAELHIATINTVLEEIGAGTKNKIVAFNKTDRLESESFEESTENTIRLSRLSYIFPDAVQISVKERKGLDKLKEKIVEALSKPADNTGSEIKETIW